jgi:hypothetical protein
MDTELLIIFSDYPFSDCVVSTDISVSSLALVICTISFCSVNLACRGLSILLVSF